MKLRENPVHWTVKAARATGTALRDLMRLVMMAALMRLLAIGAVGSGGRFFSATDSHNEPVGLKNDLICSFQMEGSVLTR